MILTYAPSFDYFWGHSVTREWEIISDGCNQSCCFSCYPSSYTSSWFYDHISWSIRLTASPIFVLLSRRASQFTWLCINVLICYSYRTDMAGKTKQAIVGHVLKKHWFSRERTWLPWWACGRQISPCHPSFTELIKTHTEPQGGLPNNSPWIADLITG